MGRLNLTRRQIVGNVYRPQVQNDVSVSQTSQRSLLAVGDAVFKDLDSPTDPHDQDGSGFAETVAETIRKGLPIVKEITDFALGETGTALRNLIPSSDEGARDAFPGEKHMVLKLKNGLPGVANFMGPDTQVVKRLKRGDMGRTASDTVAKRHDIDYLLNTTEKTQGEQFKKNRDADTRMITSLKRIRDNNLDSSINVQTGMRLIQAKNLAEDAGILARSRFAGALRTLPNDEVTLLKNNQAELTQEGFGVLPGDELKKKLLKKIIRAKTMKSVLKSRGGQSAGFIFTLSAIIAAASSAAIAAGSAFTIGAVGALGALTVDKIAEAAENAKNQKQVTALLRIKLAKAQRMKKKQEGGGDPKKKALAVLKSTIKKSVIELKDLSAAGKLALKKGFDMLKKDPSKVDKIGKLLAPHFKEALFKKVGKKLNIVIPQLGSGANEFQKQFVGHFMKTLA